jgi:hypothetical protein
MEIKTAKRIGGGVAIQTLLFVLIMLELFGLWRVTRGDFANGILFFLAEQLNPFELCGLAFLFTLTYFWAETRARKY